MDGGTNRCAPPVSDIKDLIRLSRKGLHHEGIDAKVLAEIVPDLERLTRMVGMEDLKQSLFAQLTYYLQGMHEKGGEDEYMHTLITGPPGCGKSSVAEILGSIYRKIGILQDGATYTVAKREDLVAPYLGQTAIKTKLLLESCINGVLFIDEAYSLGSGNSERDSFSKEAIDTLNAFLSENRSRFCCIIAGYAEEIDRCFFQVNQGLSRRFPWVHNISPYTDIELAEIMVRMISDMGWQTTLSVEGIATFIGSSAGLFKNYAGDVETFLSKCKRAHAKRVVSLSQAHRLVLTAADLQEAKRSLSRALPAASPDLSYLYT